MTNFLNIRCPKCDHTDGLVLVASSGNFDLGPYCSEDEAIEVLRLCKELTWKSVICCDDCCHAGPIAGFKGDIPAILTRLREAEVMTCLREALTLDYRKR